MPPILFPLIGPSLGASGRGLGMPALLFGRLPMTPPTRLIISGVTKDSTNTILGSCTVKLYRTADDVYLETCVSDAVTGAYSFSTVGLAEQYYVVAYKPGAPDVAGTTANTLVGT